MTLAATQQAYHQLLFIPTRSVGICGQADVARSRCWSCRMPSSGVSLLAMTPKSDHRRALASRLRMPNWPCAANVWVDAYGVTAAEPAA